MGEENVEVLEAIPKKMSRWGELGMSIWGETRMLVEGKLKQRGNVPIKMEPRGEEYPGCMREV